MGANFGDLDNDGFLDMYLGTGTPSFAALMPNVMLKNVDGKRFVDVTEATGTGHLQKGHGIAFVDIDNDGDEDVLLNVGGAVPGDNYGEALFENPGDGGRTLDLGEARRREDQPAGGRREDPRALTGTVEGSPLRYREVTSGGSFGANSFTQHIGLGGRRRSSRSKSSGRRAGRPRCSRTCRWTRIWRFTSSTRRSPCGTRADHAQARHAADAARTLY